MSAALPRRATEAAALVRAFYGERPTPADRAAGSRAYCRFLLLVPRESGGLYGLSDDGFADLQQRFGLTFQDRLEAGSTVIREWNDMVAAVAARQQGIAAE